MGIRSRHSRRALAIRRSAIAFALGARTGALMIRTPMAVNTASNAAVNLAAWTGVGSPGNTQIDRRRTPPAS